MTRMRFSAHTVRQGRLGSRHLAAAHVACQRYRSVWEMSDPNGFRAAAQHGSQKFLLLTSAVNPVDSIAVNGGECRATPCGCQPVRP